MYSVGGSSKANNNENINQESNQKLADELDQKLIELLLKGYANKGIALSTIRRRIRRIFENQNTIPAEIIAKLARIAGLDAKLERLAIEMAHKSSNHILGKSPNELSVAYMYMAAILLDVNLLQIDLPNMAGITEVVVRNRCNDILTCFKLTIEVKPLYPVRHSLS